MLTDLIQVITDACIAILTIRKSENTESGWVIFKK